MKDINTCLKQIELHQGHPAEILQEISGYSNRNYIVLLDGVKYILRIPQETTLSFHYNETETLQHLIDQKCDVSPSKLIVFNGFHLIEYIEGTLLQDDADLALHPEIVDSIAELHRAPLPKGDALTQLQVLIDLMCSEIALTDAQKHYLINVELNKSRHLRAVVCHSDLHSGNIVFTPKPKFIDFEYASLNYNYYELACFFAEFCGIECRLELYPSKDQQRELLSRYFGFEWRWTPEEEEVFQFFEMVCFGVWGVWGRCYGFTRYTENRLAKFFELLEDNMRRFPLPREGTV